MILHRVTIKSRRQGIASVVFSQVLAAPAPHLPRYKPLNLFRPSRIPKELHSA